MDEKQIEDTLIKLDHLQSACTRCGLCLETCATFQQSGWEQESPRGRIQLAYHLLEGQIEPKSSALETFDRCLGCHACETICPARVDYTEIRSLVQLLRLTLAPSQQALMTLSLYKKWIKVAYRLSSSLWRRYGWRWINREFSLTIRGSYLHQKGSKHIPPSSIVLVVGCIQDLINHEMIENAQRILEQLGYATAILRRQPCCGAIFNRLIYGGKETLSYPSERQKALYYQQRCHQNFMQWAAPFTLCFLSMGCQCHVHRQLPSLHMIDLYHLILEALEKRQLMFSFKQPREIYYQPFCGYKGQQEKDPVWQVLQRVKGLIVKEMPFSYSCCGGYGGESVLHPEQAQAIAKTKQAALPDNAEIVITSPECQGQFIQHGQLSSGQILYPIQLLAQAQIISISYTKRNN